MRLTAKHIIPWFIFWAIFAYVGYMATAAHADDGYPSAEQMASGHYNSLGRTIKKCWAEQLYTYSDSWPHKRLVGVCWKPHINFCFRMKNPRRVGCWAAFTIVHIRQRRNDVWQKFFAWRVYYPWMGFLFAHESPVNRWVMHVVYY